MADDRDPQFPFDGLDDEAFSSDDEIDNFNPPADMPFLDARPARYGAEAETPYPRRANSLFDDDPLPVTPPFLQADRVQRLGPVGGHGRRAIPNRVAQAWERVFGPPSPTTHPGMRFDEARPRNPLAAPRRELFPPLARDDYDDINPFGETPAADVVQRLPDIDARLILPPALAASPPHRPGHGFAPDPEHDGFDWEDRGAFE